MTDRNTTMLEDRMGGESWAGIASRYGISAERARQVVYAAAARRYFEAAAPAGPDRTPGPERAAPGGTEVPT